MLGKINNNFESCLVSKYLYVCEETILKSNNKLAITYLGYNVHNTPYLTYNLARPYIGNTIVLYTLFNVPFIYTLYNI